jgi:predicted dehydrogenase
MPGKRIALVGCGRIGFLFEKDPLRYKPCTHAGGALSAGIPVTHACDIDPKRLEEFRTTYDIPAGNVFEDYHQLLKQGPFDLVIIATWTESHCRIATEAVKTGARMIVLEKPVCASLAEAKKLLEECAGRKIPCLVNHERRYDSRYRTIRELVTGGKIGRITSIHGSVHTSARYVPGQELHGGGPLLHDGTHLVDLVRFLAGDFRWVRGSFERLDKRKSGFENRATGWYRLKNGADFFIEAGGGYDYFQFEVDLTGTLGRLVAGNGYQRLYLARSSRYYTGFRDLVEVPFPEYDSRNCFTELYREAGRILQDGSTRPQSDLAQGYADLEAIHGLYLSAYLGREVGFPVTPRKVRLDKIFNMKT